MTTPTEIALRAEISSRTADTYTELSGLSREPFLRALTHVLEAGPSHANLRAFASNHPDRWANTITILAKLAGFTPDTLQINGQIAHNVAHLSDMEISRLLDEARVMVASAPLPGDARAEALASPINEGDAR